MTLNIQQANLSFPRTPTTRTQTNHILIHHRDGFGDVASLRQVHVVSNNWGWVGYHYYVRLDGSVWQILPINAMGIHAREPRNSDSIAICFEGRYHQAGASMPTAQYNSGVALLRFIRGQFNVPISQHKDHVATACPGQFFPFTRMRDEAITPISTGTHTVVKGETLTSIARLHNVSIVDIMLENPIINNPNHIKIGQIINIPKAHITTNFFFPKTSTGFPSIVNMLNSINVNSSFANRSSIARVNGISGYTGSISQNEKLANLLKNGKLIRN